MSVKIYNDSEFITLRRNLRKNQTDVERKLWQKLRGKQILGLKFFRQYSVGNYILDFYCPEKRLAIELDGSQHMQSDQTQYDEKRTKYLEDKDINLLRFWNNDIINNMEGVLQKIVSICSEHS